MSFMGTKKRLFMTDLDMRRNNKVALKVELSSALFFRKISACCSPCGFVSTSCTRSRIAITQLNCLSCR